MALLGFEGFDNESGGFTEMVGSSFGPTGAPTGIWTANGGGSKVAGLLGGSALGFNNTSANAAILLELNYATLIAGLRIRTGSVFGLVDCLYFMDGGTVQCGISVNALGKIIFWRGSSGTVLATGTTTLIPGAVYMVDITVTINSSTGSVQVNLGGVSEIPLTTGLNTRNSSNNWANGIQFHGNNSSYADDFYLLDTTGSAPYNAPLGVIRAETAFGVANNSVTWTPLTSTNVSQIQEVNMDSDTSYNFNSTTGIDTFTHGALSSTPVTIFAVDIIAAARKTDVTAVNYRTKLISGATTQNGATSALATVYQYVRDSYQNDPNTGSPWTATAVNATDIGYEKF